MKTAKKRALRGKTNAAGRELMAALHELHDAVMGGDTSKLTRRTVEIPEPAKYAAKDVKALRGSLGMSQGVLSHLLAVSPELVSSWEYGIRKPSPLACRLMDQIKENPATYLASVVKRKSA
jgi:putative transcriptional regulator